MTVLVEKKFAVEIVYNGVTKPFHVESDEQVVVLLKKAIETFGVTQNPHLLSLFRQDGSVVPEHETIEQAGLKPKEVLLLRPNAVKGGGGLHLAQEIIRTSFRKLRGCGHGECECAVYWTGPASEQLVDEVEHPIHRRSPFGYEVNDTWLTEFWKCLALSKRSVKAQVHTHPGRAFHSASDDQWPIVSQVGFISIVIPDFAKGKETLDGAWVGRLGTDGQWHRLASADEAIIFV